MYKRQVQQLARLEPLDVAEVLEDVTAATAWLIETMAADRRKPIVLNALGDAMQKQPRLYNAILAMPHATERIQVRLVVSVRARIQVSVRALQRHRGDAARHRAHPGASSASLTTKGFDQKQAAVPVDP